MTPRNEDQFQEIREKRRQELKSSAVQLFSKKGFADAKISDITSHANLSHGLFYHYFSSKEELYIEVIRDVLQDFIHVVEKAERRPGTALDKMEWLTDITHSGSIQEGVYRHILVLQALYSDHLNEPVKHEIVALYKKSVDVIAQIIAQGQQEELFISGDPAELATYHLALSHGLLLWNGRTDEPLELSTVKVLRQLTRRQSEGKQHE